MVRASVLGLLLTAAAAFAGPGRDLTPEQRQELVEVLGAEHWGAVPPWRQRMLADRYAHFLDLPEGERERILRAGLREYLVQPPRVEPEGLPPELRAEVDSLPPDRRPIATKLAALRLQHLRLDRHLSTLAFADRRPIFLRLFPEPFDPEAAMEARHELERRVARAVAARVRERVRGGGDAVPREEFRRRARAAVEEIIRREEQALVEQVGREVRELGDGSPRRVREELHRRGFPALERMRLVLTPRQGELVRWAFDPRRCPLIDPEFLGPAPEDPAERRAFEEDWRILARLDLLSEAGLPVELVLHLAGSVSPEDFLRGVEALRGPEAGPGPGPPPPPGPGRGKR